MLRAVLLLVCCAAHLHKLDLQVVTQGQAEDTAFLRQQLEALLRVRDNDAVMLQIYLNAVLKN